MKNCSKYGIEIFNVAKTELSLVLIFGGLKPINHTRVIEAILKRKKLFDMNIKLPRKFDIRTELRQIYKRKLSDVHSTADLADVFGLDLR